MEQKDKSKHLKFSPLNCLTLEMEIIKIYFCSLLTKSMDLMQNKESKVELEQDFFPQANFFDIIQF